MLHYVHQLVADLVCLLFGAEQAFRRFLELFHWKQLPATAENDTWRVTQNSVFAAKQWAETH